MPNTSPMPLSQVLFSFEGRISRSTYWLKFIIPVFVISIALSVLDLAIGTFDAATGVGLFVGIFGILVIYPEIAVFVKRLHDRNRSGWFVLLLLVPLVNIWIGIEMAFLRGTRGENRFGADPATG